MYNFYRYLSKILSLIGVNRKEFMNRYFRRCGINVGKNSNICSDIRTYEPQLISIGENVTISDSVKFITHDASIRVATNGKTSDLFGPINIGDNCFIGAGVTIMYGVSIKNNTIVAAGSVVTKSNEEEYTIIGGNPAKKIGIWSDFAKKAQNRELVMKKLGKKEKKREIENEKYWIMR